MRKLMLLAIGLAVCLSFGSTSCVPKHRDASAGSHAADSTYPGLHNVLFVDGGLINGSCPEGDQAFDTLAEMGVKTILCVDGAEPDVDRAERRGMRYVHLPIGYDTIDEADGLKFIRAARDLPKPIYVHCFHGKHRSPAVVALVSVGLGRMSPDDGVALMKRAGVSANYGGLYESVSAMRSVPAAKIDAIGAEFPSVVEVTGLVARMAAIGRTWDHIKLLHANTWMPPPRFPDLDAGNESKMLAQRLRDMAHESKVQPKPIEFARYLEASRQAADDLAQALTGKDYDEADDHFARLDQSCNACHEALRN